MLKYFLIATCALLLANCATPAQVSSMIGTPSVALPADSPLRQNVEVNAVSGGQETNPLWTSEVGNPEFQAALAQSLTAQGMLSTGGGRYRLDATLMEVDQPMISLATTVTSTVRYVVTEVATSRIVFDEAVTASYTAELGESFYGVERLRLANEGSIRTNIASFLDQLIQAIGRSGAPISALEIGKVG
jgi:hypothetical protein